MAKYEIAGIRFKSKKQIEQHVREILASTSVGSELQGNALTFVLALLQQHHRAREKQGSGVAAIRVDLNTEWKAWKMFTIVRSDGSETDFSYRACIYPRRKRQDFQEACRQAVVSDVLQFKRQHFLQHGDDLNRVTCPVTGRFVHWDEAHIDHDLPWPFREIVRAYCLEKGIQIDAVELDGDGDGEFQHRFREPTIVEDFREFHRQRAQLRIISKEANLRTKRSLQNAGATQ